jgi:hypothetical protein
MVLQSTRGRNDGPFLFPTPKKQKKYRNQSIVLPSRCKNHSSVCVCVFVCVCSLPTQELTNPDENIERNLPTRFCLSGSVAFFIIHRGLPRCFLRTFCLLQQPSFRCERVCVAHRVRLCHSRYDRYACLSHGDDGWMAISSSLGNCEGNTVVLVVAGKNAPGRYFRRKYSDWENRRRYSRRFRRSWTKRRTTTACAAGPRQCI